MDNRSLNNVTIKDRFPIPIMDELLDELWGSTIFFKVRLKIWWCKVTFLRLCLEHMKAIMNS